MYVNTICMHSFFLFRIKRSSRLFFPCILLFVLEEFEVHLIATCCSLIRIIHSD
jgi:hypothetical protein